MSWSGLALAALIFVLAAVHVLVLGSTAIDEAIDGAIHQLRSERMTSFVKPATHLASLKVELPLALLVSIWLIARYRAIAVSIILIGSPLVAAALNIMLKNLFKRPRPEVHALIEQSGFGFPSGHAMMATAFYGALCYLIRRLLLGDSRHKTAAFAVWFAVVWIGAAGFFRIYLGVHYTTDVIAGYAAGVFVLLPAIAGMKKAGAGRMGAGEVVNNK